MFIRDSYAHEDRSEHTHGYTFRYTLLRIYYINKKFYGKKPDLSHVWIFISIAFVHIPNEKRQKLDPKLEKCIPVGYSLEQKGYKCFNPSTRKVRESNDVFAESTS